MTIEELEQEIGDHKVMRHQFQCFINVYSEEEAQHFYELGAYIRPAGGQVNPATQVKEWGTPTWEVFLVNLHDPVTEERDGEEVDVTNDFLLNHFRERDGYAAQLERIL